MPKTAEDRVTLGEVVRCAARIFYLVKASSRAPSYSSPLHVDPTVVY